MNNTYPRMSSPQRAIDAAVWIVAQLVRRGSFTTDEFLRSGLGCTRTFRRDLRRVALSGVRFHSSVRFGQRCYVFDGWAEEARRAA